MNATAILVHISFTLDLFLIALPLPYHTNFLPPLTCILSPHVPLHDAGRDNLTA